MSNKVNFGLSDLYIAKRTESGGVVSYGTPVKFPGAVSLTLDASEGEAVFYADNVEYYRVNSLLGREGDLEVALVPETIKKDFLGYVEDDNDNLVETNKVGSAFALIIQVQGDEHAGKICFLNGVFGRPSLEHSTMEDSIDVQTFTLPITFSGENVTIDGESVQIYDYTAEYGDTNYATFESAVTIPTFTL